MATITVRPRVQLDRFSLYWKESMATKTEKLPDVVLETASFHNLQDLIESLLQHHFQPATTLEELEKCRLEGFQGPWVRVLQAGKLVYATGDPVQAPVIADLNLNSEEPLVVVGGLLSRRDRVFCKAYPTHTHYRFCKCWLQRAGV